MVSGGGGGLGEGAVSLGRIWGYAWGPSALTLLVYVLHRHQLLQRLGGQLFEGLHVGFHLLQVPLELGTAILEPRDHLSVGQAQLLRYLVSIRRRQVFLVQKALLQLVDLVVGESRPGLSPLFRGLSLAEGVHVLTACGRRETGINLTGDAIG